MRSPTPATRTRASCWRARRPASRSRPKAARTNRSARRFSAWASRGSPPSSRPSPTSLPRSCCGASDTCRSLTAGRSIAGFPPATIDQPAREIDAALRHDLLAGVIGSRSRRPTRRSRWSFPAPSRPSCSLRTRRWRRKFPASACSPSPRPTASMVTCSPPPRPARAARPCRLLTPRRCSAGCHPTPRWSPCSMATGRTLLARHGRGPPRLSARRHGFWRVRRYPGALRQALDRYRRHPRHGGACLRRPRPAPRLIRSRRARHSLSAACANTLETCSRPYQAIPPLAA